MIEIEEKLYTTTAALAVALRITPDAIRLIVHRRADDFENCVTASYANDFEDCVSNRNTI